MRTPVFRFSSHEQPGPHQPEIFWFSELDDEELNDDSELDKELDEDEKLDEEELDDIKHDSVLFTRFPQNVSFA